MRFVRATLLALTTFLLTVPFVAQAQPGYLGTVTAHVDPIHYDIKMDAKLYYSGSMSYVNKDGVILTPWDVRLGSSTGAYVGQLYCVQLNRTMSAGNKVFDLWDTALADLPPAGEPANPPYDIGIDWAAHLYSSLAASVSGSATGRAALQLAIWEALYDHNGTFLTDYTNSILTTDSVVGGNFYIDNSRTQDAVVRQAEGYLNTYQDYGRAAYWQDGQDLIGPIPEPGVLVVVGLAFAGMGAVRLRRRRRSS